MASTTAQCPFCGTSFTGVGKTHNDAVADANKEVPNHAFNCVYNSANQE